MARKDYNWENGAIIGDHSKGKHIVLENYFAEYLKVRCQHPHQKEFVLTIIDGFCGGGKYEEDHDGSPIIFLKTLKNLADEINLTRKIKNLKEIFIKCYCIFNDKDPSAIESLRSKIQPYIANCRESKYLTVDYDLLSFDFRAEYHKISQKLEARCITRNVFFNLDQCGTSLVKPAMVRDIFARYHSSEVILTFSIQSFLNFFPAKATRSRKRILENFEVDVSKIGELDQFIAKPEKKD